MKICTFGLVPHIICIRCQHNLNNHEFEDEWYEKQEPPIKDGECKDYKEMWDNILSKNIFFGIDKDARKYEKETEKNGN